MNNINKESEELIKDYSNKNRLNKYIREEFLTSDGDAHIYIKLSDKYELFDKRTSEQQLDINQEIYSFIDDKSSVLDSNIPLHFHIIGLKLNEKEQENINRIIKEHYSIELYKKQREYRLNKDKAITQVLLGVILLLFYGVVYIWTNSAFLLEVFGFLFSFALWQAFEICMYTLSEIKHDTKSIAQKQLMDVDFE